MLGTVEGLKKLVAMRESPYHSLNFCQGTVGEMLEDPGTEIFEMIRWFGERDKIFNVHFRNIRGRKLSIMETFPDEGDMDMLRSIRLYAELDTRINAGFWRDIQVIGTGAPVVAGFSTALA